jgi:uncharacterized membrane protein
VNQEIKPVADITQDDLESLLRRAFYKTLIIGTLSALAVLIGAGWRSGAMLATGVLISAASILEWRRLVRLITARLDQQKTPASAPVVVLFFVLRLGIFAAIIYGSLKCFHGSITALFCGVGLAACTIAWEAISLLR